LPLNSVTSGGSAADFFEQLHVEGHNGQSGQPRSQPDALEKRAQAVVAWLVAHDVSATRLTAKGLGQTKPVADNYRPTMAAPRIAASSWSNNNAVESAEPRRPQPRSWDQQRHRPRRDQRVEPALD